MSSFNQCTFYDNILQVKGRGNGKKMSKIINFLFIKIYNYTNFGHSFHTE